jgi:DNA-binding transcriptional LysR family regulator
VPERGNDLDLRLVRYFVTVAEHQHFGRAAEALYLAQPSLSRQIQRLERQLGARLLDRSARGTELTAAGAAFLPHARALLRAAADGVAAVHATTGPRTVTIGHTAGLIVTPAVAELRRRHQDAQVHTQHLDWDEPRRALIERRIDIAVARLPFSRDGLRVRVLYDEPLVLVVPLDHSLVGADSVALGDIADEPLTRFPDDAWNAFWRVDPRPDGSRVPDGPLVHSHEDNLEAVAQHRALTLAPVGARPRLRPDLTTIVVRDAPRAQVVVASRADDRNPLVAAFARYAAAHLPDPPEVVAAAAIIGGADAVVAARPALTYASGADPGRR